MARQKNGTGSFRVRKDGSIEYRVSIGMRGDGTPDRKSFYGSTKRECVKRYQEWLNNGQNVAIERVTTVGDWAIKWLELYKHVEYEQGRIAWGTYHNYEMYIKNHIVPKLGCIKFTQVRPAHIQQFFKSLDELSDSARHHIYVAINGIFETAIKNHLCAENPVETPKSKPLQDTISIKVFSPDEIAAILRSDHPCAIYPQLLLYTGLRVGEVCALIWPKISEDIIDVSASTARVEGGGYADKSTKSGKDRYVGITPKLQALLDSIPKKGLYVITDEKGIQLTPQQFYIRYRRFFRDTGLQYLSPHKCRHTYATYLVKGGAELRSVQALLGHSDVHVTEIYTHIDTGDIRNNVRKLPY